MWRTIVDVTMKEENRLDNGVDGAGVIKTIFRQNICQSQPHERHGELHHLSCDRLLTPSLASPFSRVGSERRRNVLGLPGKGWQLASGKNIEAIAR